MFTFIAVVIRILVNPLSNVFQKRICNNGQSALFVNFLTYFALSVIVIPLAFRISWTAFPFAFWVDSLLIGFFGALSNCFLVKAIRSGELSVLGPINAYKSVIGVIFGIIFLAEIPSLIGLFGIVLIVGGSYYVIDDGSASGGFSWKIFWRSDLRDRIAAIILTAIEIVFIKKTVLYSDAQTAFIVWCMSGTVFALVFISLLERHTEFVWHKEFRQAYHQYLLYLGLIGSVGLTQAMAVYVLANMYVGYALALFQLSTVLSVFYGWFFFNETKIYRKLIAAAIMIVGSMLIILWS
ncbi:MAG: DMT family transporter [Planctomycetaceae bacterium]|jgi:drug/metabolite transporter (DMT)-like permease|nr:DMT family transporter [Planctomycetaceae bacterium]